MSTTPRPSLAEENADVILNFALANPSDVGDLGGLTVDEIDAAVRYARRAVNTFDEARAALESVQAFWNTPPSGPGMDHHRKAQLKQLQASIKAVLAKLKGGAE